MNSMQDFMYMVYVSSLLCSWVKSYLRVKILYKSVCIYVCMYVCNHESMCRYVITMRLYSSQNVCMYVCVYVFMCISIPMAGLIICVLS